MNSETNRAITIVNNRKISAATTVNPALTAICSVTTLVIPSIVNSA